MLRFEGSDTKIVRNADWERHTGMGAHLQKQSKQSVLLSRLLATRELGIFVVAALAFVCFCFSAPRFLTAQNLVGILREASLLCIVAVGMTYLLVAGEFDLSVGANYG